MSLGPEKVVVIVGQSRYQDTRPLIYIRGNLGPEKVVEIRNIGTVALSGPMTFDLYRGKFGTSKKWS